MAAASWATISSIRAAAAPDGFGATAGDTQVTLSWNNPDDSTIDGYQVLQVAISKLVGPSTSGGDRFGDAVGVDNNRAAVGAPFQDTEDGNNVLNDSGLVHLFHRSSGEWSHITERSFIGVSAGDNTGASVAVDGRTVVAGVPEYDRSVSNNVTIHNVGRMIIYHNRQGPDWGYTADPYGQAARDEFGTSVSVDGGTAVVGAPLTDVLTPTVKASVGTAYVYSRDSSDVTDDWSKDATLTASNRVANDRFGSAVAVDGDTVVVGAQGVNYNRGAVYVFTKTQGVWSQSAQLAAPGAAIDDAFGFAVAVHDDFVVVGARGDDDGGSQSGSAFVFTKPNSGWGAWNGLSNSAKSELTAKLTASDAAMNDRLGWSVAVDGGTVLAGAYWEDENGSNSGSVYLFTKPSGSWVSATETVKLTAPDGAAGDFFGYSVAAGGGRVIVGAPGDDNETGAAYVFSIPAWSTISGSVAGTMSHTVTGLTNDVEYTFLIRPVVGSGYGPASESKHATPVQSDAGAPTGLSAVGGDGEVTLSWNDPNDSSITKYKYRQKQSGGTFGAWTDISGSGAGTTSHTVTGLNNGRTYTFRIRAVDEADDSDNSNDASASTIPTAPANLTAAPGDGRVGLTWDDPNNDTITKYQYRTGVGAPFTDIPGSNKDTAAYTFTGLANGTTHTFAVRAVNAAGNGPVATVTALMVPAAPANFSATPGDGMAALSWDNPQNTTISKYQLLHLVEKGGLTADDGAAIDRFGVSVAVDGNTAVVGAFQPTYTDPDTSEVSRPGVAYVFTRDTNTGVWTQKTKLTAADGAAGDLFGVSVAVDGNTVVIGARGDDSVGKIDKGAIYVFRKPATGWPSSTTIATKITATDGEAGDLFGASVALYGDSTIVAGAPRDEIEVSGGVVSSGSAYVFTRSTGPWSPKAKLTASNAADDDQFGNAVALDGNIILVGAYGKDGIGTTDSGLAYLFVKPDNDDGWTNSTETVRLRASDRGVNDNFGRSVVLDDATIVVGASGGTGSAYVFTEPSNGWVDSSIVTETAKLTASDGADADQFGRAVAVDGSTILVGGHQNDDKGSDSGSIYVFTEPTDGWADSREAAKLTASDGRAGDRFGIALALDGDTALVAAPRKDANDDDDDTGNDVADVGSAYVLGISEWTDVPGSGEDTTSHTVSDLTNNVIHTLALRAVNPSGYGVASIATVEPIPPPDAPANLLAAPSDGRVALTWDDPNNDTITKYQHSTDGGTNFSDISGSNADTTAYTVTGLNNGTTYTLAVRAVNPSGDGAAATVTAVMIPAAPANLSAAPGDAQVVLSWEDPGNDTIDNYRLLQLELAKLTVFGGSADDTIGWDVAIDGDTAVVGAPGDSSARGAAYVFARVSGAWTIQATLTASVRGGSDFFGSSVAVSGDTVVVGATRDDDKGSGSGSVYVFTKPVGGWAADDYSGNETAKLLASDGANDDNFGRSVAVDGDTVAVGALRDDDKGSNSGSAYVFTKPSSDDGWNDDAYNGEETAKLLASDGAADDQFGISVAMDRDTVVVGSHGANGLRGKAYVFTKPVGGWVNGNETARLTASDRQDGDQFGLSVAIDVDTVVVGAIGGDDNGTNSGSAYVFTKPSSDDGWNDDAYNGEETAKLTASDGAAYRWFGFSVAVYGDVILAGAPTDNYVLTTESGSAYLFTRTSGTWSETAKLNAPDAVAGDRFGYSAALDGKTALVGAVYAFSEGVQYVGGAYVFDIADWDDISGSGPTTTSHTVTGLANYQEYRFLTRAVNDSGAGTVSDTVSATPRLAKPAKSTGLSAEAGDTEVRLGWADPDDSTINKYQISQVIQDTKLIADDGAVRDRFGISVAVDGDTAVVGAFRDDANDDDDDTDNDLVDSGSAYIFTRHSVSGEWIRRSKLTASDGAADDQFGWSVALEGDTVVVGAYRDEDAGDDPGDDKGSAYVFVKPSGGWASDVDINETAKLIAPDRGQSVDGGKHDLFGVSVAVDVDDVNGAETVVVGAPFQDYEREGDLADLIFVGSVYVFTRPDGGWDDWGGLGEAEEAALTAKLTTPTAPLNSRLPNDLFGFSVAVDGEAILASSHSFDDSFGRDGRGRVYVFTRPADGWVSTDQPTLKLTASDGAPGDWFGYSVALDGDTAAIGARLHNDPIAGAGSGSAYVFTRESGVWGEKAKLTPSNGAAGDQFGFSIAVDGDNVVVGAWEDDDHGPGSGSAYLFTKPDLGWAGTFESLKLTAPDGATNDRFGVSVAVGGITPAGGETLYFAVVGAHKDDNDAGMDSGSVYVLGIPDWNDIDGSGSDTTTHTETGLNNGTEYSFQIRALNQSGAGPASDAASATPMPKPLKPTWMAGDSGDTQVRLRWVDPDDPSIAYYQYQQKAGADDFGNWMRVPESVATTTEYTVTGLQNGTLYVFKIRAVNDIGDSPASDERGLTPEDSTPVKPTGLTAIAGNTQVQLSWFDSGDRSIDKYQYQWTGADDSTSWGEDGSSEDWIEIPQGPGGAVAYQFTVTGLTNGVEYTFQIRAVDTLGPLDLEDDQFSEKSEPAAATPEGTPPARPANLKAQAGDMQAELSWDDPDDSSIESYRYAWSGDDGSSSDWTVISESVATTTSYTVAGLTNGVEYTFSVRAENDRGTGKTSTVSAKPLPPEPDPPDDLTAAEGDTLVKLTWEDPADSSIQKYEILHLLQVKTLTGEDNDNFGYSVAVDGDIAVIGAYRDDDNGDDSGAVYVYTRTSGVWDQGVKLTAPDGVAYDNFGISVAVDDNANTVVVGASGDDDTGTDSGSVYVFVKPATDGGWNDSITERAKLTAPDGESLDYFGISVAVDGDSVLVGAYRDDEMSDLEDSGSAYMFTKPASAGGWSDSITQTAKLTASDRSDDDNFGISVAVDSGTAVIGSPGDDDNGIDSGSAYIFVKPSGGWIDAGETAKLTAPDGEAGDSFGYSVAVDGNTVVVGAHQDDDSGDDSGSVYVFTRPTSDSGWGAWDDLPQTDEEEDKDGLTSKFTASDGEAGDSFGYSVAVDVDSVEVDDDEVELATILVGAYRDDDSGEDSGSTYVFSRDSATGGWTETNKLTAPNGEAGDWFGYSVAVDTAAHSALVGAGSAHMLDIHDWAEIPNSGAQTTGHLVTDLTNSQTYDFMVRAVNIASEGAEADVSATPEADANINPEFSAATTTRSVAEDAMEGGAVGSPVMTGDPDDVLLTYSLTGDDAASFDIATTTGQITVGSGTVLDFESATTTTYTVIVSVHDGKDSNGKADASVDSSITVTIKVDDVDEDGTVSLIPSKAQVNAEIIASLTDPDGSVSITSWQWATSTERLIGWNDIPGANTNRYTPVADDLNYYLRATASYTDVHPTEKIAYAVSSKVLAGNAKNAYPYFADGESITFWVFEDAMQDDDVGRVTATDLDGDTLTYSVSGLGEAPFVFATSTSKIFVRAKPNLDFESDIKSYSFRVSVHDGKDEDGNATTTIDAFIDVIIRVDNVEEAGMVSLPAERPRVGVGLTASLTDPDGLNADSIGRWRWARSIDDSTWHIIAMADSATYTPAPADLGKFLRATASYRDGHGENKSASGYTSQTTANTRPTFPDDIPSLSVEENSTEGVIVGSVTATDVDGDTLTYSVSGLGDTPFVFAPSNGTISVGTDPNLDFESATSYTVTVLVHDGKNIDNIASTSTDATITVTINVNDVNEAPAITEGPPRQVNYAENGTNDVAQYVATDPEGATITWSLSEADDSSFFMINDEGVLSFISPPDYESPPEGNVDNKYLVTVQASDGTTAMATLLVTVTVTDVDEVPSLVGPPEVDYAENDTDDVAEYIATDPEGATVTWSLLEKDDSSFFVIADGVLRFESPPNYESPPEGNDDNKYLVTVQASDGTAAMATLGVTVSVTDVNEVPVVNGPGSVEVDYPENSAGPVKSFTASDPDVGDTIYWSLGGVDAKDFSDQQRVECSASSPPLTTSRVRRRTAS